VILARLVRFAIQRPNLVRCALVVVTVLAGFAATHLEFDFSPQSIFESTGDLLEKSEEHRQAFGYEDSILVVALNSQTERDVVQPETLSWLLTVGRLITDIDSVERVDSIATLSQPKLDFGSGLEWTLVPVLDEPPVNAIQTEQVRLLLDRLRLLNGSLISADRRLAAIIVFLDPDTRDYHASRRLIEAIESVIDQTHPPEGYTTLLGGMPMIRVDAVRHLQADQLIMFPLSTAAFLLILVVMFRGPAGTVAPLVAVCGGVVWTLGMMAVTSQTFSLLSNVMPTLLLVVGVSNCVHILSRYAEESARNPGNRIVTLQRTMTEMASTCLLTFLTTAIGFASLIAARSVLLQRFSVQTTLGMVCQYFSVLLFLTVLLPLFRPPKPARQQQRAADATSERRTIMDRLADLVIRRPRAILCGSLLLVVACAVIARGVSVNSRMIDIYDESHPSMQTIHTLERQLAGVLPLEIHIESVGSDGLLNPDVMQAVREFTRDASREEHVTLVRSWVDVYQQAHELLALNPAADESPLSEASIGRISQLLDRFSDAAATGAFLTADRRSGRILMRVHDVGSLQIAALAKRLEQKLTESLPPDSHIDFYFTGDAWLHTVSLDDFVSDLFRSLLAASLIIFAVIALLFRSARVGLIASIPNLTPLIVTVGYMGLRGYDMTGGNVIVFAISLGIAVDDTIHFLSRFREELQKHSDGTQQDILANALRRTFAGSGHAILMTTILIICGLSVLMLSDFVPTRRFAELTSVTMLAALVGDLLLLPACLLLFWKRDTVQPDTDNHT